MGLQPIKHQYASTPSNKNNNGINFATSLNRLFIARVSGVAAQNGHFGGSTWQSSLLSYHLHRGWIPEITPGSWQPQLSSACKAFQGLLFSTAASSRRNGRSTPPSCRSTLLPRFSSSGFCST